MDAHAGRVTAEQTREEQLTVAAGRRAVSVELAEIT